MSDTLKSFLATYAIPFAKLTVPIGPRGLRWPVYGLAAAVLALGLGWMALRSEIASQAALGPGAGPRTLPAIQDAMKGRLYPVAWPANRTCPAILTPSTPKVAKDLEQRFGLHLSGQKPDVIVATGQIRKGEAPYGGEVVAVNRGSGQTEQVFAPSNPFMAWENRWSLTGLVVRSAPSGLGGVLRIGWEPASVRIGKSGFRAFPRLELGGTLYSGRADGYVGAGLEFKRP